MKGIWIKGKRTKEEEKSKKRKPVCGGGSRDAKDKSMGAQSTKERSERKRREMKTLENY